jgi:hypothetical protein
MRPMSPAEYERWMPDAYKRGFGCFKPGGLCEDGMVVRFTTLALAPLFDGTLRDHAPALRFPRAADGQIVVPGRCWNRMFQQIVDACGAGRDRVTRAARLSTRRTIMRDVVLAATTDTVIVPWPDESGELMAVEALVPGTTGIVRVTDEVEATMSILDAVDPTVTNS